MRAALAARNGDDVRALVEQPGEGDLARADALACCQLLHHGGRAQVGFEVLALIARIAAPVVAFRVFLGPFHPPGEKPPSQRGEGNQTDAELAQQRNDARLEVALPERVLAL